MIPTTNISTTLVGNELGINTRNVKELCTSDKINIFSYLKPKMFDGPVFNNALLSGFTYSPVKKLIIYDKPTKWFRLGDFRGYDHYAIPPTIDIDKKLTPIDKSSNSFTLVVRPYFGDPRYEWGKILGGHTWADMVILIECYSQRKELIDSHRILVKDIHISGNITATIYKGLQIKNSDSYIFVKGYFCSNDGTIMAPIPTTGDGFVQLPIVFTQSVYIYLGNVEFSDGGLDWSQFAVRGELIELDGGTSGASRIHITNNSSTTYQGGTGRPYAKYRWRSVDGTYTGTWQGGLELPLAKNIPGNGFTRSEIAQPGAPPTYGSITKWYVDWGIVL